MTERLPQIITREEWERLSAQPSRQAVTGVRNLAMLVAMYDAGFRSHELVGAAVGHVVLTGPNAGTLRVHRGKGGKDRNNLRLPPASWAVLERWLQLRARILEDRGTSSRVLFCTLERGREGRRLDTRYIRAMVARYSERAGVFRADGRPLNPHMLRHTYATRLINGGAALTEAQRALGHARPRTTERYLHVDDRRFQRSIVRALELADVPLELEGAGALDFSRMATR